MNKEGVIAFQEKESEFVFKEYSPKKDNSESVLESNVIYFGGTFEEVDSKATEELKQYWANYSNSSLFAFEARVDANEVINFIEGKSIDNLVLAGYSQGAQKAVEISNLLEEKKKDRVKNNGLILIEATGLYDEDKLTSKFISEGTNTSKEIFKSKRKGKKKALKKGIILLSEIISKGVSKLVKGTLKEEIELMSKLDDSLDKVESPIVLVQGKNDKVSSPKKIAENNGENEEIEKNQNVREEKYLKNIFLKSKKINWLIPDQLASHALPVLRGREVAKTTLYMLARQKR